jgi:hypothetical protein
MSNASVTPVATRTSGVFHSDPLLRFQQAIDFELQVADLDRRLRRLEGQLNLASARPARRSSSHRSVWWPCP